MPWKNSLIQQITLPPRLPWPAISVIIPMYNAEKYIGECLDSILAQTFQNFEVIIVDDCSTDSSYAIVENYRENFGGRLTLSYTQENSGGGGYVPRNIGLGLSRGEYIFFVDADDFISKTALEELYTAAENFGADVVYTGAYYSCNEDKNIELKRDKEGNNLLKKGLQDKPTLTIDDAEKNLQRLLIEGNFHTPWAKLVQRKFLIENELTFPKIISGGDFVWTISVFYYAKKLLRISTPIYFYREDVLDSVTRQKKSATEQLSRCISAFMLGAKVLHELSSRVDLLKNPNYFRVAVNSFFHNALIRTFRERMQLNTQNLYEILCREFDKEGNFKLSLPFLFSVINGQYRNLVATQQQFRKFATQTQEQVKNFNKFAQQARQRIAELEAEVKRLQQPQT